MTSFVVAIVIYVAMVGMIAYLALSWLKDCKKIEEWNSRTDNYLDNVGRRVTEMEVRIRSLENDLGVKTPVEEEK